MSKSAHVAFSLDLHHRLAPPSNRSCCWSPYSVVSALALAATAVAGTTRAELDAALRSGGEPGRLLDVLGPAAALADTSAAESPVLAVANTLWAHEELPISDSFIEALKEWPGSAIRNAPFRADPDGARRVINDDVAETTRGLIPELLAEGTVDPDTVAALVNALYLKVSWREAFDDKATEPRAFRTPAGARDVPTMHATRRFGYAARDGWQVVALPAAGDVEAVLLLPDGDLEPAESGLTAERLEDLLAAPQQRRLELSLPRFRVNWNGELNAALGSMGVRTLFTSDADFSPLTDQPLRVSTVVHQAVLDVAETGLEGAAATAVMMRLTAIETESPLRVEVNRPFLCLVRHRDTGAIYFLARITDPS